MQLDLLRDDAKAVQENSAPPKSVRRPQRHYPALESQDVDASALPELPESLRPTLLSENVAEGDTATAEVLEKAPGAFKTISETANLLGVPQHVLRFWESRFPQIKPMKLNGGRRYYRPQDIDILQTIKNLLYKQGYTIKGAKKAFTAEKRAMAAPDNAVDSIAAAMQSKAQLITLRQELMDLRDSLKGLVSK